MSDGKTKIKYVNGVKVVCNYRSEMEKSEVEARVMKILIASNREMKSKN